MHRTRQSLARLVALGTITLAACQDASQPPTAPALPQAPSAARSPQAQARLEAIFQSASPEVMAIPGTVFADNDEVAGKVVSYTGDSAWNEHIPSVSRDADLLIAECYSYTKPIRFHMNYPDIREHWDVLRHAQVKDPTVGVLTLLEKFGRKGVEA